MADYVCLPVKDVQENYKKLLQFAITMHVRQCPYGMGRPSRCLDTECGSVACIDKLAEKLGVNLGRGEA